MRLVERDVECSGFGESSHTGPSPVVAAWSLSLTLILERMGVLDEGGHDRVEDWRAVGEPEEGHAVVAAAGADPAH